MSFVNSGVVLNFMYFMSIKQSVYDLSWMSAWALFTTLAEKSVYNQSFVLHLTNSISSRLNDFSLPWKLDKLVWQVNNGLHCRCFPSMSTHSCLLHISTKLHKPNSFYFPIIKCHGRLTQIKNVACLLNGF